MPAAVTSIEGVVRPSSTTTVGRGRCPPPGPGSARGRRRRSRTSAAPRPCTTRSPGTAAQVRVPLRVDPDLGLGSTARPGWTGTRTAVCGRDVRAMSRPSDTAMPMTRPGRVSKSRTPSSARGGGEEVDPAGDPYTLGQPPGPHPPQTLQRGDVDQLDDRGDDDGRQRRLGQLLEESGQEEQGHHREHGRGQTRDLDLAPAPPLTAVFDRLPLTTMPLASPAPRLAAPRPTSSRFASTS